MDGWVDVSGHKRLSGSGVGKGTAPRAAALAHERREEAVLDAGRAAHADRCSTGAIPDGTGSSGLALERGVVLVVVAAAAQERRRRRDQTRGERERERHVQRLRERRGHERREEAAAGEGRRLRVGEGGEDVRPEQVLHRVVAEERGEQRRHGRQVGDAGRVGVRDAVGDEAVVHRAREARGEADDHQREEDPDRQHRRRVLERRAHARAGAALVGGQAVHDRRAVGRGEQAHREAVEEQERRERDVGEVDRQQLEQEEAHRGGDHAAGRERPRAVAVGEIAGHGAGDEEPGDQREHVDARPQRRLGERVAVAREPDPLQPDDEDELQAAAADRGQQGRDAPGGERADAEEREVEHRLGDPPLDEREDDQEREAADQRGQDAGRGPAHRVPAVRLDAVGDPDHDRDQAHGERDVAPPVDPRLAARAQVDELAVGPDRPEHADRHGHDEHEPPLDRREDPAEHEADERPGDRRDAVDAEREAALVARERVGEDRAEFANSIAPPIPCTTPHADHPDRGRAAAHPRDRQQDRAEREHGEAEVVHPHAPVDVAEAAEAHDEHRRDDEEAQDHPQQVVGVAGGERVDVDAAEDVRQGDQQDRRVHGRHQDAERRVREGDPLVAVGGGGRRHRVLRAGCLIPEHALRFGLHP